MFRRSLPLCSLASVFVIGALLSADLQAAGEAVPASCLVCRHTDNDTDFVKCLSRCMAQKDGIGLTPIESDDVGQTLGRWTFKEDPNAGYGKAVRTATLDSDSAFRAFNRRVEPKLVLTRERTGQKRVFIDLEPAKVSPFEKPITVRINRDRVFQVPVRAAWSNHAFLIDDAEFYREIKHARRLTFTVETMGAMEETVHFETAGIRRVIRWLDGRD